MTSVPQQPGDEAVQQYAPPQYAPQQYAAPQYAPQQYAAPQYSPQYSPQYGYPLQPDAPARPTNVLAVISLILSLLGISIGAVITGHISLRQVARTGEQGHGMAVAGLVIGYAGCVLWVMFWLLTLVLPFFVVMMAAAGAAAAGS